MQYKHVFHAGNFADVHKHIALLQLIQSLQKKAKGFLFLDTHAGEGLYDLASADARHGGESEAGITRVEQGAAGQPPHAADAPLHPAIQAWLTTIARIRAVHGGRRSLYPGSPLLAAAVLRDVDQALFVESQAQVARALQRAVDASAALLATTPRVITGDGFREVKAQLPPALRRGLTLIDPPYEAADEEQRIAAALTDGLLRFETGVFAVWYPIKKQHDTDLWLTRVTRGITRPTMAAELCIHPPDNTGGLNGSGMLVVNPPWQFDVDADAWQQQLHALLGGAAGSRVKWLVNE